ncbi:hypothetical protein E2C01_085279 [Portunus trituberculatus]|uniref:Uncharacterized protein n=1 Tax=Portunus trituberculatus TaxID=210409 RepID=A0A5B7J280_PORTR|nr:hypothetical protein [Portunus trituberculatus]
MWPARCIWTSRTLKLSAPSPPPFYTRILALR